MEKKLRYKFMLGIVGKITLALLIIIVITAITYRSQLLRKYGDEVLAISHGATILVDSDYISTYKDIDVEDDEYKRIQFELEAMKHYYKDIDSIYVFVPVSDSMIITLYDIYIDDELKLDYVEQKEFGSEYSYEEVGHEEARNIYMSDSDFPVWKTYSGENATHLTGYAPVINKDGHVKAIIAVGYDMKDIDAEFNYFVFFLIAINIFADLILSILIMRFTAKLIFKKRETLFGDIDNLLHEDIKDEALEDMINRLITNLNEYKEDNDNLKNVLDEYEKYDSLTSMIQNDLFNKTIVKNYEDENMVINGNIHSIGDYAGDFYDCFLTSDKQYVLSFAGVMERNVAAALYMVFVKMLIRDSAMFGYSPEDILDVVNNRFSSGNDASLFAKAFVLKYDPKSGIAQYSSASGIRPILVRKSGEVLELSQDKEYMPIGAWDDTPYERSEVEILSGDILIFYSQKEGYDKIYDEKTTREKLARFVKKSLEEHSDNIIEVIMNEVKKKIGVDDFEYSLLIVTIK